MLYSGEGGREKHSFDEERSSQGRRSSNVASLGLSTVLVMTGGGCTELAIRWEKCKLFYFFMNRGSMLGTYLQNLIGFNYF